MDIRGISKVKLQTVRDRDRVKYFVYLPKELVERLGWVKGDVLTIDTTVLNMNVKTKREWLGLVIYRKRDREKIIS